LRAWAEMGRGMLAVMARYRADVMMERTPQTPFMIVIISANRKFLHVSPIPADKATKEVE